MLESTGNHINMVGTYDDKTNQHYFFPCMINLSYSVAHMISEIVESGRSFDVAFDKHAAGVPLHSHSRFKAMCYQIVRYYPALQVIANLLVEKPVKPKNAILKSLIISGLGQLLYLNRPEYTVVDETVTATRLMQKKWAAGWVNALLRQFLRDKNVIFKKIADNLVFEYAHPLWLIHAIKNAWPEQWQMILNANNEKGPMCLRLATRHLSRAQYQEQLRLKGMASRFCAIAKEGIYLEEPVAVTTLPGFTEGYVSVQDEAAQCVVDLAALQPGLRVLDVCAAPGGKMAHALEREPTLALVALEIDDDRFLRLLETKERLKINPTCIKADASQPEAWYDGQPFDRILCDLPCSGTGVIRRHPDIKILRRPTDLPTLIEKQEKILASVWPLLSRGGLLIYSTCSILPEENSELLEKFVATNKDAEAVPVQVSWGQSQPIGRQLFPTPNGPDGFYFAVLKKK